MVYNLSLLTKNEHELNHTGVASRYFVTKDMYIYIMTSKTKNSHTSHFFPRWI